MLKKNERIKYCNTFTKKRAIAYIDSIGFFFAVSTHARSCWRLTHLKVGPSTAPLTGRSDIPATKASMSSTEA